MQNVYQLSKVLADTVDKFEGISETARNFSIPLFAMLTRSFQGIPWDQGDAPPWVQHVHCLAGMLTESGFYMLGYGYFSMVLGHDDQPHVAFKVSLKPEDSYVAFAMYCRQNPSRHLPVILHMLRSRESQVIALKRYLSFHSQAAMGAEFPYKAQILMQYWWDGVMNLGIGDRNNPIYTPEFIETCVRIGEHFEGTVTFDLHQDNMMYDPDLGEFIITDPVSFKKEITNAFKQPRKNSDRTDHFAAAQARTIVDAAARGIGARVEQVQRALPYCNPCEVPQCSLTSTFL